MGFKWRKFHSAVIIMLSMVLLFSIYTVPVTAEGERDTVRFGFYKSEKYGYTDANGDWRGFDVHIVKTIGMYGNFNAEVHGYDTVTEMEEALRKGEVDALVDFIHTDKRDSEFIFTDNTLLNEKVSLFTHNAPDAPVIKDITEARNLRIGSLLNTGYRDYFINYCLEHGFTPNLIEFNSEKELRQAMEQGLVDVCLTGSAVPAGCRFLLSTVSLSSYIMLRADSSALRDRIDLAMNLLTTDYPNYIPNLHDQYTTNVRTDMTPLAPNEKKYLAEHPVILLRLPAIPSPL